MRFGENTKGIDKTVNYEGEVAYKLDPALELYSAVCCASLQPKFYVSEVQDELDRLRGLIAKNKPEFVSKLAVYAREKMYLRSIPLVLAVELAKIHKGNSLVSKMTSRVIQRADELTEILAYYEHANEREGTKTLNKLSKQLQKGIAEAFHKFDEYQLGKYSRDTAIKLRDVLFLTHPKPRNAEEEALFKKVVENTLGVPYTWETQLSALGQQHFENEEAKQLAFKNKWEELIDSEKVGYMAQLRNSRNVLNANVSREHIIKVAKMLSDPEKVRKSKQLPFRFLSAYRELQELSNPSTSMILNAMEDAVLVSAENIKGYNYDTTVCIACDVSGSMQQHISPKSKVEYYDIGLILGMLLQHKCKSVITGIFGDIWKVKQLPQNNILQNVKELYRIEGEVGYSTNGWRVIEYLIANNVKVDKIMMFTDCQLWDSTGYFDRGDSGVMQTMWSEYKRSNPDAKMYLFDLAGYGNTPLKVNKNDVFLIAGWSNEIFNILHAIEQGDTTIDVINRIEI